MLREIEITFSCEYREKLPSKREFFLRREKGEKTGILDDNS